jgi:hypothetical protein
MSDADELVAEVAAGRALALQHPLLGLPAAGTHPFHAVAGRVRRSGAGWTVETVEGEEALIVPLDDARLRRLRLEDWSPGDRDLCLLLIRQSVAPSARDAAPTWAGPVAGARPAADLGPGQE